MSFIHKKFLGVQVKESSAKFLVEDSFTYSIDHSCREGDYFN